MAANVIKTRAREEASALLSDIPERFDMARHYAATNATNYVYFAQSAGDKRYVKHRYGPFKNAVGNAGPQGVSADGRRRFVLYDGTVEGHGNITSEELGRTSNLRSKNGVPSETA